MKRLLVCLTLVAAFGLASSAYAGVLVYDTWLDGTRTDPASPTYSEFGVDADFDGNLESAWFRGGSGVFDPVGAGGPLRLTQGSTSSSSLTTYFTPEGSEVALANAGDSLKLTWAFTVSGTVGANTSQGLRLALVDSPSASRVTGNASPGNAAYTGYGMFLNINTAFSHSRPFELMERNPGDLALLSSSSAWTGLISDGTSGNTGYAAGSSYTFLMTLTRTALGELAIAASMTGGSLNGVGLLSVAYTDSTPNGGSFAFDTFQFRPDGNDVAYDVFDTTLFKVEFTPIPEPSAFALAGLAVGLFAWRRRNR